MSGLIFTICALLVVLTSGDSSSDPTGQRNSDPGSITNYIVAEVNGPEVIIAQGPVRGFRATDGPYFEFHGIPYADSTSGIHRFKAPRPPPQFQGPFIANQTSIKCVRALGVGFEGTEDCLVANVFTSNIANMSQMPVMVWIKGTEFDRKYQNELSFRNFMRENVVVVSLNYRESIFGFLCLGTEGAPGNAGLKDIIAGLKWVKENIAQFGGNPNDITLFGHGSGGAAVDLITLSPLANGLVNRAIAQSGSAMAPWAVSRDNLKYAIKVAEDLGQNIHENDIEGLSNFFTRTTVHGLMAIVNELDLTENALAFGPCIERPDLDVKPFLTKTPFEILDSGEFLRVPFIAGFVENEGTIRAVEALEGDWLNRMNTEFVNFLQSDLKFENEEDRSEVAQLIKHFYFEDGRRDLSLEDYIAYHGETMVLVSSIREVRMRAKMSPTFLYQFSYKGQLGEPFQGPLEVKAAAHSEELAYLFSRSIEGVPNRDRTISDILVERWTNFAKTGAPTSRESQVTWEPFTTDNNYYLHIRDKEGSLEQSSLDPHTETIEFWDKIYEKHFLDAESNWSLNDSDDSTITTPAPDDNAEAEVTIAQGKVVGFRASDGDYFKFQGIPYADSTSGAHRFKAPRAPPIFRDPFIANRTNIKCVRALGVGFEGTEDCLVANVFTSNIASPSQVPVMVWIKGTEFDRKYQNELSFRNFMTENVVVVSLNYRESILGFLCLGTETAPGNAGLKDIIAGLKWVKENIAQFGGNPNDITLFGHGSGGAAVDLITLSPKANDLVNRAIAQSGSAMAPWAVSRDNLEYAIKVAEGLGHIITDIQELSLIFTRTSLHALMEVINQLDLTENALAFAPCIEREELADDDALLVKTPYEILFTGNFPQIPFIAGFVENEGTIRAEEALESNWLNRMNTEFVNFLQSDLKFENEEDRSKVAQEIKQFYIEDNRIELSLEDYIAYHGETMVLVSSIREVRMRAKKSPTFLYQFSYKGQLGEPFMGPLEVEAAAHSEELAYLFHRSSEGASSTDLVIAQILVERWTNFAKTGSPTSKTSNVTWQPFTTNNSSYLRILSPVEIGYTEGNALEESSVDPHPETVTFWEEIYENHFLDAESNWILDDNHESTTTTTEIPENTPPPPREDDDDPPVVTIAQGKVVGSLASDGEYFKFLGIPYADSTSGTYRFKAPRAPPPFEDSFFANRSDIKCVRPLGVGFEGTEDCLVVNVFTPTTESTSELPVMVWIKGTEFDGVYENELSFRNFVKKDVVVVSLNYRESILGFLCLGTQTAPGNAGLKDIIAGLRWVKENIAQFGGNPDDITIFGHGSGGAAVDLITLSPMANDLVHKAITQSGSAMAPWAVSRDNLQYAIQVAEGLGHVITDIQQLSELFTRASVAALMAAINKLDLTENALAFAPCIEREALQDVEPFLTKTPSEILASSSFLHIPFITGFVDNEGTIRAKEALEDDWLDRMNTEFVNFLQSDLNFETDEERSEVAQKIKQFYFKDNEIDLSTIDDYIKYHGDTMMLVSTIREVRIRAASESSEPIYLYQFSYEGALGESFVGPLHVEGAAHSEELAYLFHNSPEEASITDLTIGQILVERWTNFAKTGVPTSSTSDVGWKPFTADNNYYLRILAPEEIINMEGSAIEISLVSPHPDTLTFWDEIYADHFQDAESNWNLNDGATPAPPVTPCAPCSSTSLVNFGYTLLIVAIFSILNRYHLSQLVN